MPSTPRSRSLSLALILSVGCTPEVQPDPGALSAASDPGTTGDIGGDATDATTTADVPTTGAPDPTTGGQADTDEPASSDSSTGGGGSGSGPSLGGCPLDPPALAVAVARTVNGLSTDLSSRPCGVEEALGAVSVIAAGPDHLTVAVCADGGCGACDLEDTLSVDLTIPAPALGLPPELVPGECLRLAARWDDDATGGPGACGVSSLAVLRRIGGTEEPVPRFMLHRGAALPATDTTGEFSLTGASAGPGKLTCPCDADCCLEPPGTRRVRFTAARDQWEVEAPPIDPGEVVPLFALGVPDGDDLFGTVSLVDARVPLACDGAPRYEWTLAVAP